MYRIFVIEDDASLAAAVKRQTQAWGYETRTAANLANVIPEFLEWNPHLVLVDIMLPFYDGYHWCSEIRKISGVPVIFLSSAADNMNIVMAMNMGGDDFIAKPFDLTVLIAKINAVLRRTYELGNRTAAVEVRGAVLNLDDGVLLWQNQRCELTRNEYRILRTLMESAGKTVSRDTLMTRLWENDLYVEENTLTVNINRLRRKLESIGLTDFIRTQPGQGYIIDR